MSWQALLERLGLGGSLNSPAATGLTRRAFLARVGLVGGVATVAAVSGVDLEHLLWTPGAKTIFLPPAPTLATATEIAAVEGGPALGEIFYSVMLGHGTGYNYDKDWNLLGVYDAHRTAEGLRIAEERKARTVDGQFSPIRWTGIDGDDPAVVNQEAARLGALVRQGGTQAIRQDRYHFDGTPGNWGTYPSTRPITLTDRSPLQPILSTSPRQRQLAAETARRRERDRIAANRAAYFGKA